MKYLLILISVFMFSNCSRTNHIYNSKIGENEITIELIPSSVHYSSDDTLHFKYKITNKSSDNLLFYHLQHLEAISIYSILDSFPIKPYPGNHLLIIDKENKLPQSEIRVMGGYPKKYRFGYEPFSYIILPSNDSKVLDGSVYIGYINLEKGDYRLALEYFSYNKKLFTNHFKKEKREKKELMDYKIFYGIINSDTCSLFTLPETIDAREKFRKKHESKDDSL